ncbi:MAG: spore coat U domain-containing protein [Desulfobulbaceae bacterium]|nr:spore coat U domain-containing protein [Desulfobulbaceae bacterium]
MNLTLTTALILYAILLCPGPSFATMGSNSANYTLTLINGCSVDSSAASTFFGTYPVNFSALFGVNAGSIEVNCNTGTIYRVGMDHGLNNTLPGPPAMKSPADPNLIYYFILVNGVDFGDSGLNAIDGSYIESNPATAIDGVGTSSPTSYYLTADIGLVPTVGFPSGTYTDTVTFTVAW